MSNQCYAVMSPVQTDGTQTVLNIVVSDGKQPIPVPAGTVIALVTDLVSPLNIGQAGSQNAAGVWTFVAPAPMPAPPAPPAPTAAELMAKIQVLMAQVQAMTPASVPAATAPASA